VTADAPTHALASQDQLVASGALGPERVEFGSVRGDQPRPVAAMKTDLFLTTTVCARGAAGPRLESPLECRAVGEAQLAGQRCQRR
jgi:hypothetical protein